MLLVLMCGTAYSGKSTLVPRLAEGLGARVVSLDDINERRGLWGGDGMPAEEWAVTHEIATTAVLRELATGRSVVVDDTSSPRFLRDRWRAVAERAGAGFRLVYLDVDHEVIRRRHAERLVDGARRTLADAVLEQHLADFEPPEPDEEVVRVRPGDGVPDLSS